MTASVLRLQSVAWFLVLLGVIPTSLAGAQETRVTQFQQHLAAGRFPEAVKVAREASDRKQHDAMLAATALGQLQTGQRDAAFQLATEIYDAPTQQSVKKYMERRLQGPLRGGAQPDFESLIELITATIAPDTWDAVGGPGAIDEFAGGVYVDAVGTLRPLLRTTSSANLTALQVAAERPASQAEVRRSSRLRTISLPRLERELQRLAKAGEPVPEEMEVLAGLQRIRYVFVYPESGDLVLAGPAGDWQTNAEERPVSVETGKPVVRLDDLVVIFRHLHSARDARFGCSITPTQDALARTQAFLAESSKTPLRPGRRNAWLAQLRRELGEQDIDVFGLDPRTRVARVMVEADYRMKLVGLGLEEGVLGVDSYLDSLQIPAGQAPPPLDVLRWWFTLNYQAVLANEARSGFELRGQGVKVLSENELLTELGERVHTGASNALNQQFAHSFTTHFAALAKKYPIYAELQNLFDLALVGALLRAEELPARANWEAKLWSDPQLYSVSLGPAAKRVETVINHRVINKSHVVAGVSGGVSANPAPLVERDAIEIDKYGLLEAERAGSTARDVPKQRWWWD